MPFTTPAIFDRYIGIDWSGAQGRTPSLQAYECTPGNACPTPIVHPNGGWNWNRTDLVNHVIQLQQNGQKLLIGLDFAFAYPFCDVGAYFPGNAVSPGNPFDLWAAVDGACAASGDFYGDQLFNGGASPFASYFCTQAITGANYNSQRFRLTENAAVIPGSKPGCTFHCVGASVGCATASGIRLLHHLHVAHPASFAIWPFILPPAWGQSVVVEIYPTFFFAAAGGVRQFKLVPALNAVLGFYGSLALPGGTTFKKQDPVDALISAAALRHWAGQNNRWNPPSMTACAEHSEGWIFGVQ